MQKLSLFRANTPEVEQGMPRRPMTGNPQTRTWNHSSDLNDRLFTGIWEATAGSWQISYDEWEFCHILAGSGHIEDENGESIAIGAGDMFVIEAGFKGIWTVHDTMTKVYVVLLPPPTET